jgi:DNA-binding transcriptional LysR family regulator
MSWFAREVYEGPRAASGTAGPRRAETVSISICGVCIAGVSESRRYPARTCRSSAGHACVALITLEMDLLNECGFTKSKIRQNVKIVPKLLVQGADALREAALAGCGIIRCLACHVEDELAAHKLVPVLTDLELVNYLPLG